MSKFLNTPKLNHWIPKLIQESEKELIIVAPYIKLSNNIYNALQTASNKGVNIFLIYRENKLTNSEKVKLNSIKNINLLHHPNVHCKCYYNGAMLIIGSMNLYQYSQENNREMGVLVCDVNKIDRTLNYNMDSVYEDEDFFNEAIQEIREIINGSNVEIVSNSIKTNGFNVDLIKSEEELEIEYCYKINKHFLNKKFKPFQNEEGDWSSVCESYFDNIDVVIAGRVEININLNKEQLTILHKEWKKTYGQYEYDWFKYYWNNIKQPIYIYQNSKFDWESLNETQKIEKLKNVLSKIISKYRAISGK